MTQELYKKYRPKSFKTVEGNEATVRTLQNMIERKTLPHTILFHGPSGCGKTTLARIIKKELDCSDIDFVELNCSNFRGVDTIRDISRKMNMAPTGGGCRIWLLDEVHQMTKDAQNAALKILEDTPNHVYFILCTTDPQKIINTVKSRCCQLKVELLSSPSLKKIINRVLKKEKTTLEEDLIEDIIEVSKGSGRKTLVILDMVLNLPPEKRKEAIKEEETERASIDLCRALIKKESWSSISKILKNIEGDPETIRYAVLGYARACLLNGGDNRAAMIIDAFSQHFYDSKEAGLALACYEVTVGF